MVSKLYDVTGKHIFDAVSPVGHSSTANTVAFCYSTTVNGDSVSSLQYLFALCTQAKQEVSYFSLLT